MHLTRNCPPVYEWAGLFLRFRRLIKRHLASFTPEREAGAAQAAGSRAGPLLASLGKEGGSSATSW